jgi:hypothetical protein
LSYNISKLRQHFEKEGKEKEREGEKKKEGGVLKI